MAERLTMANVAELAADPSPDRRSEMAYRLADHLGLTTLSRAERQIALDILDLMARDAEVRVRRALAEALKSSPFLPRDVAIMLAHDVESVAVPILEFCEALTVDDLLAVIDRGGATARTAAIARRPVVPGRLADAVIEVGSPQVAADLLRNEGAELEERHFNRLIDRFGEDERVQTPLVERPNLPVTVSERLLATVSAHLRDYLFTRQELSPGTVSDLVLQSRERALMGLVADSAADGEMEHLIEHLHASERLTPTLVLRALCMGDARFFEAAMARLTNIPVVNARILIHDAGPLGLKSIYEKAGFPMTLFPAFQVAVEVVAETSLDAGDGDRDRFRKRTIERILTQVEGLEREDVDYLLSKLSDLAPG